MGHAPFIALEGIDGAGKSVQCRLLADWLRGRGYGVRQVADPGGTPVGDALRSLVLGGQWEMAPITEALLFMASRAELVGRTVRPALDRGDAVVSDRFLLSNVVYQGYAGGLDPAVLWRLGLFATGGLEPDLSIVLDLPVEAAATRRRRAEDRIEGRGASHQEAVRQGFLAEARARPDRIVVVNAAQSVEATAAAVAREVERVLEARVRT
ncbi:MAG TPA: dTMP kinase [Gemmataceae bacterium]|nr:dTMP kinase [Gemmataceae bacterium]